VSECERHRAIIMEDSHCKCNVSVSCDVASPTKSTTFFLSRGSRSHTHKRTNKIVWYDLEKKENGKGFANSGKMKNNIKKIENRDEIETSKCESDWTNTGQIVPPFKISLLIYLLMIFLLSFVSLCLSHFASSVTFLSFDFDIRVSRARQ